MAIPDNYTFKATDVYTELQFSGSTQSSNQSISNFIDDAPIASFNSTYGGSRNCLRSFRDFKLFETLPKSAHCVAATGVAYDCNGNIWYTTRICYSVVKINVTTCSQTCYSTTYRPRGIAADSSGNVWTANINDTSVTKITPTGVQTNYVCASLSGPWDIVYDGVNMWTANNFGNTVAKITPTGVVTTYSVGNGAFNITFDGTHIWTGNVSSNSVSKITTGGTVTTYSCAMLKSPRGIAFDGTDIWVGSSSDASVVKVAMNGTMTCYTGTGCILGENLVFGGGYIWLSPLDNYLTRISLDGTIRKYRKKPISNYTYGELAIDCDNGFVWGSGGGTVHCTYKQGI